MIAGSHASADNSPSATVAQVSSSIADAIHSKTFPFVLASMTNSIDTRAIIPGVALTVVVKYHKVTGQTHA
jgi:hypothetical protein